MKKLFIYLSLFFSILVNSQEQKVDPVAILILDKMSDLIGDLESCTFDLTSSDDALDPDYGWITHYSQSAIIFDGPNKMLIHSKGGKGHRGFWYNGELMAYYSFDENNFVIFDALPTTLQTIDSIHSAFGIDFPAADFLYPTFTDDLLSASDEVIFNGRKIIEGTECFHIIAHGEKATYQLWISSDAFNLPIKMLIIDRTKNPALQYESTFSNWQLNHEYPPSIFEFLTPPGAHEIKILPKSTK